MALWEIVILMVIGVVCFYAGISLTANGILNAVDRYKTRRAVKTTKIISDLMDGIPGMLEKTIKKMEETNEKRRKEHMKTANELMDSFERFKKIKQEMDE